MPGRVARLKVVDMFVSRLFIEPMVNNPDALAAHLLPREHWQWLQSALSYVRDLSEKFQRTPWSHDVICDMFWPQFISQLSKKHREEDWTYVEWLVARESVRAAIHRSFAKVGQWVDEHPLLDWQLAIIEDRYLCTQIANEQPSQSQIRI